MNFFLFNDTATTEIYTYGHLLSLNDPLPIFQVMPAREMTAIVNTGDDFRHLGLHISPDIDTLLYTLSGKADRAQGWGREGESWNFMDALRSLGGEDWFALGDGDMADRKSTRLNSSH